MLKADLPVGYGFQSIALMAATMIFLVQCVKIEGKHRYVMFKTPLRFGSYEKK